MREAAEEPTPLVLSTMITGASGQPASSASQAPHDPWTIAESMASPPVAYARLCATTSLAEQGFESLRALGAGLDALAWREVANAALGEGLCPLVYWYTAKSGLLPKLPADVASTLSAGYSRALIINRELSAALRAMVAALAAERIDVIALKGVALARRFYPQAALRPVTDIDLLVHRHDLRRIAAVLAKLDYRPRRASHVWWNLDAELDGDMSFGRADGLKVEMHWELTHRPAYRVGLAAKAVWRRAGMMDLDGRAVRYLGASDELRFLCVHATADHRVDRAGVRLIWLVDIAALIASLPREWNWEAFTGETCALGLATPVAVALAACQAYLGLELPEAVLDALIAAAREPRERQTWHSAQLDLFGPGGLRTRVEAARGIGAKAALLGGFAVPDPLWMRKYYGSNARGAVPLWRAYLRYYGRVARRIVRVVQPRGGLTRMR